MQHISKSMNELRARTALEHMATRQDELANKALELSVIVSAIG